MSSLSKVVYLLIFLVSVSCSKPHPLIKQATETDKKIDMLFIGNSLTYSNKMPNMLIKLLLIADIKVGSIEVVAFPNYGLPDHWNTPVSRDKITSQHWDFVVLQQGPSATEGRQSLLDYSKGFARVIREAGARPALFMVWPDKKRFFDFDGVSDSYQTAAKQIDGVLFPVGEGWRKAWGKNAALQLYDRDGFHPSRIGSLLAAMVIFDQLVNPETKEQQAIIAKAATTFRITKDLAQLLYEAAHEANAEFTK